MPVGWVCFAVGFRLFDGGNVLAGAACNFRVVFRHGRAIKQVLLAFRAPAYSATIKGH